MLCQGPPRWPENPFTSCGDSTPDDEEVWIEDVGEGDETESQVPSDPIPRAHRCFLPLLGAIEHIDRPDGTVLGKAAPASFLTVPTKDSQGPDQRLETSVISTGAARAVHIDNDMTEFAGVAVPPGPETSAQYEATTDTGADGQADHVLYTFAGPVLDFRKDERVRVVENDGLSGQGCCER